MLKGEGITIPGHKTFFREVGTNISDRIMIAVKGNIKRISMQMQNGKNIVQTLWMQIQNQKISINIGVMYTPQDNGTPVGDLKKKYESITKEIQEVREHKQQVIVLRDFTAKVGTKIQGNKDVLTKEGMLLLKWWKKKLWA